MAKSKELNPAESILHQWALESMNGQASLPDFDPDFSASFPNLWVFLTWKEVGQMKKQPGSVTIRADGTGWRLQYYDPAALRSCAVVGASLMECLRKLDAALVDPATVWNISNRQKRGWQKPKDGIH